MIQFIHDRLAEVHLYILQILKYLNNLKREY